MVTAIFPFVIGHFPNVHWSSYLAVRTFLSLPVSVIYLSTTGGWTSPSTTTMLTTTTTMARSSLDGATTISTSSPIPWISLGAGVSIGVLSNVSRVASVFGCQELEAFGAGCAGFIGNILHAEYIATMAIFAYLFFGEVVTRVELIGAIVIGGAVVGVTLVKAWRQKRNEQRHSAMSGAEMHGDAGGERKDQKVAKGIELKEGNRNLEMEEMRTRDDEAGKAREKRPDAKRERASSEETWPLLESG